MSYDITVSEWHNYTSNMGPFFRDFGVYPPELNGMSAVEADRVLTTALVRLAQKATFELAADYDAKNGWGSVSTAIDFLRKVRDDCRKNPDLIVEVSH